jgi:hypothetical protein
LNCSDLSANSKLSDFLVLLIPVCRFLSYKKGNPDRFWVSSRAVGGVVWLPSFSYGSAGSNILVKGGRVQDIKRESQKLLVNPSFGGLFLLLIASKPTILSFPSIMKSYTTECGSPKIHSPRLHWSKKSLYLSKMRPPSRYRLIGLYKYIQYGKIVMGARMRGM